MNMEEKWFLDFSEKGYPWHIDCQRVPETGCWVNIGYGNKMVLDHFCNMIDLMSREFGCKFTTKQVIRMAECTPGLTVYRPTMVPEDPFDEEVHMAPIWTREILEKHLSWKSDED